MELVEHWGTSDYFKKLGREIGRKEVNNEHLELLTNHNMSEKNVSRNEAIAEAKSILRISD